MYCHNDDRHEVFIKLDELTGFHRDEETRKLRKRMNNAKRDNDPDKYIPITDDPTEEDLIGMLGLERKPRYIKEREDEDNFTAEEKRQMELKRIYRLRAEREHIKKKLLKLSIKDEDNLEKISQLNWEVDDMDEELAKLEKKHNKQHNPIICAIEKSKPFKFIKQACKQVKKTTKKFVKKNFQAIVDVTSFIVGAIIMPAISRKFKIN